MGDRPTPAGGRALPSRGNTCRTENMAGRNGVEAEMVFLDDIGGNDPGKCAGNHRDVDAGTGRRHPAGIRPGGSEALSDFPLPDPLPTPLEPFRAFMMELPLIRGTLNYTEQIVHCIQYETCIISSLVRKNSDIISSVSSRSLSRPQWLPRKEERSQALWIIYLKLCGIPPSCPVMGRMQSLLS